MLLLKILMLIDLKEIPSIGCRVKSLYQRYKGTIVETKADVQGILKTIKCYELHTA